jgi:hypothetical protein
VPLRRKACENPLAQNLSFLVGAAAFCVIISFSALAQDPIGGAGESVLTWQQDSKVADECSGCSYRTGENLNEGTITYAGQIALLDSASSKPQYIELSGASN